MQQVVDEADLALVHLLQIAPRITWASAAEILQLSPTAIAGRWARLRESGQAWMAVYPSPVADGLVTAFVDVDCRADRRHAVLERLCRDPRVVSVDACAQGRDFLLTVMMADLSSLTTFVLDEVVCIPGVTDTRTRLVTALHSEGSDWRLDALDPPQQRQAAAANETHPRRPLTADVKEHWPLVAALSRDARTPVADLARLSHRNAATVRRQLAALLAAEVLSFRCDASPAVSGWPIACSWLARVNPGDLPQTIAQLSALSQLRMCASVTGDANLVFTVYSRTLHGLSRFERAVGQHVPALQPVETMIHLRTHKKMGWLLAPDGRCTGEVVVPEVLAPVATTR